MLYIGVLFFLLGMAALQAAWWIGDRFTKKYGWIERNTEGILTRYFGSPPVGYALEIDEASVEGQKYLKEWDQLFLEKVVRPRIAALIAAFFFLGLGLGLIWAAGSTIVIFG